MKFEPEELVRKEKEGNNKIVSYITTYIRNASFQIVYFYFVVNIFSF